MCSAHRYAADVLTVVGVALRAAITATTPSPAPSGTLTPSPSPLLSGSTGTPIWLSVFLAFLTLTGVLASAVFLRRTGRETRTSAEELDRRGKREETMRTLRWAAERAVSTEDRDSRLGIAALDSLGGSAWLEVEDQALIDAVISSVTAMAADAYREVGSPTVYEVLPDDDVTSTGKIDPLVGGEGDI